MILMHNDEMISGLVPKQDSGAMYMAIENISLSVPTRTFNFASYFADKQISKIERQFAILMTADANVELQRTNNSLDYDVILINKDGGTHTVYVGYYVFT